jgi:uncharacterized membrane protein YoaK (UPF0700 family)
MKKISLAGLILGVVLGTVAGMLSGSWIFWLGVGLAIGVVVGSVIARRTLLQEARLRQSGTTKTLAKVNSEALWHYSSGSQR